MSKFKVGDKVKPKNGVLSNEEYKKYKQQAFENIYWTIKGINEFGDMICEDKVLTYWHLSPKQIECYVKEKEKPPIWYTLPAPVEEKIEPDYKGFYGFIMEDKNWGLGCNACVVKDTVFCTKDTSCFTATRAYAENKFIKRNI